MLSLRWQINLLLNQIINSQMNFISRLLKKSIKQKVYSSFRDNIWVVDLADVQSLSKYNKGIKYLLCAIDLSSKYAWVVPLKDKRPISIVNAFQKIISKDANQIRCGFIKVVNYNNTGHRTTKMQPIEVTYDPYAECNEDFNQNKP